MCETLKFLKIHPNAKLPTSGSIHAAGLDLYATEDVEIHAGKYPPVKTGLSVAIPPGFYGRVAPRSGLAAKRGIDALAGVIDSDYRGEIICVLINHGDTTFLVEECSRIAQIIVESIATPDPEWAEQLNETKRDVGGFGSTGIT